MKKRQQKKNDIRSALTSGEPYTAGVGTPVVMEEKFAESRGDVIDQAQDQIDADLEEQIYQSRQPQAGLVDGKANSKRRPPAEQPPGART